MITLQQLKEKLKAFVTNPAKIAVAAVVLTGVAQYFTNVNPKWSIALFLVAAFFGAFGRAVARWADTHTVTLVGAIVAVTGFLGDFLAAQGSGVPYVQQLFGEQAFTYLRHIGEILVIISRPFAFATNGLDTTPQDNRKDEAFFNGRDDSQ